MTISGKTKVLAIFGDPVAESLSPLMHNSWIEDFGLDAVYVPLSVTGPDPAAFFYGLRGAGFLGANVTTPHKEIAAAIAESGGLKAANVLRWEEGGRISAFNTDGDGFLDSLDEAAPGWKARVRHVLIIGAGGAAAGLGPALAEGAAIERIRVVNRTASRADALARLIGVGASSPWEDLPELFAEADLIINTTTLGMAGRKSPRWPVSRCKDSAIVADIVYQPLRTPLLDAAAKRELQTVDGLGMLIHQGARAFELWFGLKPDTKKARERLMAALGERA